MGVGGPMRGGGPVQAEGSCSDSGGGDGGSKQVDGGVVGRGGGWAAHRGPCRASYLARTFLQRPSSFRRSATSWRSAPFSFSRKPARMAIWFSFSRRASRERLAATLFFLRLAQYFSSCFGCRQMREKCLHNRGAHRLTEFTHAC